MARFVTSIPNSIMFPRLYPESTSVKMFADASYNNLPNGSSQGEHLVFLPYKSNNSCAVAWNSKRIKSCKIHIGSRITCLFRMLWHGILDLRIGQGSKYRQCKYKNQCLHWQPITIQHSQQNKSCVRQTTSSRNIIHTWDAKCKWNWNNIDRKQKATWWCNDKKGATPFTFMETCQQGRLAIDNWENSVEFFILKKKTD